MNYTGCFRLLVRYVYRVNETNYTLRYNFNPRFLTPEEIGNIIFDFVIFPKTA